MARTATSWLKTTGKALLSLILVGLFIFFLINQRQEISHLGQIVASARLGIILMGVFILGLYILGQGLFYEACFRAINKTIPLKDSIVLYLKRFFVSSFIPTGFSLSQYTFTTDVREYKVSRLESHLVSTIYLIMGAVAYLFILIPTLIVLFLSGELSRLELYTGYLVVALTIFVIMEFFALFRQEGMAYHLASRFIPDLPSFVGSWRKKELSEKGLKDALILGLIMNIVGILLVVATLAALNLPPSLFLATIIYVMTILLLTISPMFQGLGVIEFSLTYSLTQFGLSSQQALATTLLYRLFQLWLPFIVGMVFVIKDRVQKLVD